MKKILIGFVLFLFLIPSMASATDWYVRPEGGNYSLEDGTSYENAWDGLPNVVWGVGGVTAGDTLYICGLHHRVRTEGAAWVNIDVESGTVDNRIVVRGDCPTDPGIVWGGGVMAQDNWTYEGNNTYSMQLDTSMPDFWLFEDVTATSWTILDNASTLQDTKDTPGTYYSDDYQFDSNLYVHMSDNGDPTNRITRPRTGYRFNAHTKEYITWLNLKVYLNYNNWLASEDGHYVKHMKWDNCTVWYGESNIFKFTSDTEDIEIVNCDIAWSIKEGIGVATYGGATSTNYTFKDNVIHDIGVQRGDSDAHGIGMQGGTGIIEGNEIYNVGSGITMYAWQNMGSNTTIRYNYIHDMHMNGGANGRGIELNMHPTDTSSHAGKVYNNIVANCSGASGVGYRSTFAAGDSEFYNNVAYNCDIPFFFEFGQAGTGQQITMKNNIALGPSTRHIYFENALITEGNYYIISDYNIFYPISGNQFRFRDSVWEDMTTTNFTGWQSLSTLSKPGCTFDPNSLTLDPLFVDPDNGDFRLQAGSPAIDAGIDVGLTQDYEGNAIPQDGDGNGSAEYDIGAYEFVSGSPPPQTCSDGTSYGECSFTQPQYCDNGTLVDDCDTCLCPGGYDCLANGSCQIPIPGDLNNDGYVDILDLGIITPHFGKTDSHPEWNATADVVSNNEIDIYDVVFVASRFT